MNDRITTRRSPKAKSSRVILRTRSIPTRRFTNDYSVGYFGGQIDSRELRLRFDWLEIFTLPNRRGEKRASYNCLIIVMKAKLRGCRVKLTLKVLASNFHLSQDKSMLLAKMSAERQ